MASVRTRDNGKFTGMYRDRAGAQRSAGTYPTKKAALKAARAAEAIEATGRSAKRVMNGPALLYSEKIRGHVTVAGYAETFLAQHRLEDTSRETYTHLLRKHIISALGTVAVRDLDPPKVREFVRGLDGKVSPASVGHILTVLRAMCRMAVEDDLLTKDPTANVRIANRRAKEMKILSPDEYRRIVDASGEYSLLIRFLVASGLRWGEALAVRPSDIGQNEAGQWVVGVRRTIAEVAGRQVERDYGKTKRAMRDVSVDPKLAAELKLSTADDGRCFTAHRGGPLFRSYWRRIWCRICAEAGVAGVRTHDLRHTSASWLLANGADLVTVRDRLGHSDLKTTSKYLHVMPGAKDVALDAMARALAA